MKKLAVLTKLHKSHISGAPQCDKLKILSHCFAPSAAKCKILPLCPSMFVIYATCCLGLLFFCASSNASALTYTDNVGLNFTFNPSITVSLSSSDIVINDLTPGTSSDSNTIIVNVLTNNANGYELKSSVGNSTTYNTRNLIMSSGTANFASIDYGASESSLTVDNTWGYSYSNDNSTWTNYDGLPKYDDTTNIATLKTSTTPSASTGDNTWFKIGAKASTTQSSGEYNNVINFIAVGNTNPTSFYDAFSAAGKQMYNGYYKMQDMDTSICNSVYTSQLQDNTDTMEAQLIDIRDNNVYWVAKLKDGHCWMTQNLDLDLSTEITLTHDDTDLGWTNFDTNASWTPDYDTVGMDDFNSEDYLPQSASPGYIYYYTSNTMDDDIIYSSLNDCVNAGHSAANCAHYHAGNYYNFAAAVAENNTEPYYSRPNSAMPSSICPANWKLSAMGVDGDIVSLMKRYNAIASDDITLTENGLVILRSMPLYFARPGRIVGDVLVSSGAAVSLRTNAIGRIFGSGDTAYATAYRVNITPTRIWYGDEQTSYGMSVRCLAR